MSTAPELDLSSLDKDPRLFLYTSLTAGSSHIITATSRMETILKANRIPFLAVDLATDEKCRKLWQRRGGAKKKLPGLVKEGYIIGDLEDIEEWNEFGELKENIGPVPAAGSTAPPGAHTGISTAPPLSANVTAAQGPQAKAPQTGFDKTKAVALPGAEEMAAIHKAKKAEAAAKSTPVTVPVVSEATASKSEDRTSSVEKTESEGKAEEETKDEPKDEPKEQLKEEPKEKLKQKDVKNDEPKVTFKEQPKEEVKGQAKEEADEDTQALGSTATKQDVKENDDPYIKGVAGLKIQEEETSSKDEVTNSGADDSEPTQKQDAKDPAAAGQSVED